MHTATFNSTGGPPDTDPAQLQVPRVIVAKPRKLFREALAEALGLRGLLVVGAVGTVEETVERCGQTQVDVVVATWVLNDGDCRKLIPALRRLESDPKLIVLASPEDDITPEQAIAEGVCGYVSIGAGIARLIQAIEAVSAGQVWASWDALRRLMDAEGGPSPSPSHANGSVKRCSTTGTQLSSREIEVLQLVAAGLSNEGIAEALFVEPCTVKTHLLRIFRKLSVNSRSGAVLAGVNLGWITPPNKWEARDAAASPNQNHPLEP